MSEVKQYAERDAMALDEAGGYYMRHVMAMTGEQLHGKGDIAAELAWRDMQIAALQQKLDSVLADEGYKKAFYKMAYIMGFGARPDSPKNVFEIFIKPKLEALMKDSGKLASENLTLANLITSWPQEQCPVTGAVTDVQPDDLFPATEAFLNEVRADGVAMFARKCSENSKQAASSDLRNSWWVSGEHADDFANQLRAGSTEGGV